LNPSTRPGFEILPLPMDASVTRITASAESAES
jgi:hypothetical protein